MIVCYLLLATSSDALVTSSDALVASTSSFLLLVVMQLASGLLELSYPKRSRNRFIQRGFFKRASPVCLDP